MVTSKTLRIAHAALLYAWLPPSCGPTAMPTELSPDDLILLNRLTTVVRVLAGTAHEVNNALQVIGGSAEMLAAGGEGSPTAPRAVERIQSQTARAAAAMQEVMQFARARESTPTRVSMRDVVGHAVGMRAYQIRNARLTLEFAAADAPPGTVTAPRMQLLQVVLNLIMNAEQALYKADKGSIRIALTEAAGTATLTVADNGPGIPAAVADTMFDAFASSHPVPDTPGLGLTVARIIAERLNGGLTLEPATPGCRATFRLPLAGEPAGG
jgi:two-component system, NtrC family, C4-dicarboxylate transport sensor histidine kinase DctB